MTTVEPAGEPFSLRLATPSLVALVAANLVPLAGVLWFGWDLGLILLLYWAESAVILASNLVKMLRMGKAGIAAAGFFVVHAGGFMAGHLLFLVVLFHPLAGRSLGQAASELGLPLSMLAVSHGVSLVHNTVRRGEAATDPGRLMGGFYARIFVMHLTIIFGAMLMQVLGSPVWALALLILLKTLVDAGAHLIERRKRHASTTAGPAPAPS